MRSGLPDHVLGDAGNVEDSTNLVLDAAELTVIASACRPVVKFVMSATRSAHHQTAASLLRLVQLFAEVHDSIQWTGVVGRSLLEAF